MSRAGALLFSMNNIHLPFHIPLLIAINFNKFHEHGRFSMAEIGFSGHHKFILNQNLLYIVLSFAINWLAAANILSMCASLLY